MKKNIVLTVILEAIILFIYYYIVLPPINLTSYAFWAFIIFALILFVALNTILQMFSKQVYMQRKVSKIIIIPIISLLAIIVGIIVVNLFCSPIFNAKSYSKRITVDETGNFLEDIKAVNFKNLPLLDRDSSEKLGDRVMGQMSDLVSQYYVSNEYTQINYNNEIIRVTPLEYADFIKWISNRKNGVKGYITVNSVNGDAKLKRIDKGMKYMPSAYFNENLERHLRFLYPTLVFGDSKFEIDNDGNPYWITPIYGYTGVGLKTKVTGVIILDPVTGKAKKYALKDVPEWV